MAVAAVLLAGGASAFGIDTDQPPPPGIVGTPYSFVFQLKAGAPPYAVWLDAGEIAPGLKIESDGTMHGTPTAAGTFIFTVGASQYCAPDPNCISQWGFTHVVRDRLAITTPSLPSAVVGAPYSTPVAVIGNGGKGMGWTVSAGALPPGLTMALNGTPADTTISGTPTTPGSYTFTVRVDDTDGFMPSRAVTRQFTLTVGAQLSATSGGSLPPAIQGKPYSATPATASGGLAPFTWSVAEGVLPPGLTLDPATGALRGRPTAFGTFQFSLLLSDASGQNATASATISVVRALDLRTTRLRPAGVGDAYSAALRTVGGRAPLSYAVTAGKLPAGLKLNKKTGVIRGKPKAPGTFRFRITVRDALGQRSSERLTLFVKT